MFQRDMSHPKSIETLQRHGIDPGQPRSKSWNEFAATVIRPGDHGLRSGCGRKLPTIPWQPQEAALSTPDPAKATGSDSEIDAAFDRTFLRLKNRVEELMK